jgi:hypothetical protein
MEVSVMVGKLDRSPLMEYNALDSNSVVKQVSRGVVQPHKYMPIDIEQEQIEITDPQDVTLMTANIQQLGDNYPQLTISDYNRKDQSGTLIPTFDKKGNLIVHNPGSKIDQSQTDQTDGFKMVKVNPGIIFTGVLHGDEIQNIGQINKALKALLPEKIETIHITHQKENNKISITLTHNHNSHWNDVKGAAMRPGASLFADNIDNYKCTTLRIENGKLEVSKSPTLSHYSH